MPKKNKNSCNCVNGCGEMDRQEDFNFISKVESKNPLNINPASGLPVKTYACRKCGYLELYLGQTEGF